VTTSPTRTVPTLRVDRARPLERQELQDLVREVAARPELWEEHIDPTATKRSYAALHRDEHVDIWAIFWLPETDTGFHDHDTSSGAVHVVSGRLDEAILRLNGPEERRAYEAGGTFDFGPAHIHRVSCPSGGAVSIHAYSPPLWRLGQYTVDEHGVLLRFSVNYADELRPLDSTALPELEAAA
jgi:predicted metal-dependent enzyme (double-stranded beta helix superfamily)